jgi:hypothetical protein
MQDLVNALGKDLSLVLIFLVSGATVVAIIGLFQWRKIEQRRIEAALKQEMLERGMSADDIVRVIQASQAKPGPVDVEKARPQPRADSVDSQGLPVVS